MDGVSRESIGRGPATDVEIGGVEVPGDPAEAARAERITADAARTARAAAAFADVASDPTIALQVAQSWIRDLSADRRESAALSAEDRGRAQQLLAEAQREAERAARESAASSGEIARIFGWIGAGLAALGGIVGAAFTGGASLALGIAAAVLILGAQVTSELGRAGVIEDPNVAAGVTIACSILATICSLGAASGGAVANTATTVVSLAASAAQVAGGVADGVAAVFTHDADRADASAVEHLVARDDARAEAEEDVDALGALFRAFRRFARHADEAREARAEGLRLAATALRG
jgi:hypothetical protein